MTICKILNCNKKAEVRELCKKHYDKERYKEKKDYIGKQNKKYNEENKDRIKKYQKEYYTKKENKERKIKNIKKWQEKNKDYLRKYLREYNIKQRYGITIQEKEKIYEKQNGKCAICFIIVKFNKICIDHNHKTKEVRGLLCNNCNSLLGCAYDSSEIIESAIKYLKENKGEKEC
jgi:hypothetical protein